MLGKYNFCTRTRVVSVASAHSAHCAHCDRSPLVAGTGGTLAGVARFLKSKNPGIKIFLADPPGSVLHRFVQSKGAVVGERSGSSITEGIGQVRERITFPPVSKTRHLARHVKAVGTPPLPSTHLSYFTGSRNGQPEGHSH